MSTCEEREGDEEEFYPLRENHFPKGQSLYSGTNVPEWNFLCWLVERREREREGEKLPFGREQDQFQDPQEVPRIS
jgi:hypothetical protein